MSLIEQVLDANDSDVRAVECPEWGLTVHVRTLMADEADALERHIEEGVSQSAALVGLSLCDEDGTRCKMTPSQMHALGKKSAAVVRRIANVCLELNGWDEDAKKNSEPTDASNSS